MDEEYINQKTDALLDAIYAENATVDGVSQKAVETVEEVFEKLDESGVAEFQGAALTEENKEEIKNSIAEALSVIADENGNIDADDLAANLFWKCSARPRTNPNPPSPPWTSPRRKPIQAPSKRTPRNNLKRKSNR